MKANINFNIYNFLLSFILPENILFFPAIFDDYIYITYTYTLKPSKGDDLKSRSLTKTVRHIHIYTYIHKHFALKALDHNHLRIKN